MGDTSRKKMLELQDDVRVMREIIPKKIVEMYEKHIAMLETRSKELNEEEITVTVPNLRIKKTTLDFKCPNNLFDHNEAIVMLNSRIDALNKANRFLKKPNQNKIKDVRI